MGGGISAVTTRSSRTPATQVSFLTLYAIKNFVRQSSEARVLGAIQRDEFLSARLTPQQQSALRDLLLSPDNQGKDVGGIVQDKLTKVWTEKQEVQRRAAQEKFEAEQAAARAAYASTVQKREPPKTHDPFDNNVTDFFGNHGSNHEIQNWFGAGAVSSFFGSH